MTIISGTQVPDGPGAIEVCHHFTVAVLKAKGALGPGENDTPNPQEAQALLFPGGAVGYSSARTNGNITVQAGAIVGFWNEGQLQHSMFAETQTTWWGANNTSVFGSPGGRFRYQEIGTFLNFSNLEIYDMVPGNGNDQRLNFGWIGQTNQWRGRDRVDTVTWRMVV